MLAELIYDYVIPDQTFPDMLMLARHRLNHKIDIFFPYDEVDISAMNIIIQSLFIKNKIQWDDAEFALSFYPKGAVLTNLYKNCYGTFIFIREISYGFDSGKAICFDQNTVTVEIQKQKHYPWYKHYRTDLFPIGFQEMKMFMRNADRNTVDISFTSDLHKRLLSPKRLRFSLENGLDPNTIFYSENRSKYEYLLHRIIKYHAPARKKIKMLMILCDLGGNMLVKDSYGRNALFPALKDANFSDTREQLDVFIDLIESYGVDPFSKDLEGWDVFRYAQELSDDGANIWKVGLYLRGIMCWENEMRFRDELINLESYVEDNEEDAFSETTLVFENEELKRRVEELTTNVEKLKIIIKAKNDKKRCFCIIM